MTNETTAEVVEVLRELDAVATEIHDTYMRKSGFCKVFGKWLGVPGLGDNAYVGNANGAFAVRAMIRLKLREFGYDQ